MKNCWNCKNFLAELSLSEREEVKLEDGTVGAIPARTHMRVGCVLAESDDDEDTQTAMMESFLHGGVDCTEHDALDAGGVVGVVDGMVITREVGFEFDYGGDDDDDDIDNDDDDDGDYDDDDDGEEE